ncbi:hypothetical protein H072_6549 [Dactylellina haptotyla CBS 200.50]|uniref:Pectinesterase n=1 Tax=Dactylellina haptotyla (strain CBS 200.50) TaxID=1284197 RepID=S8A9T7_DACHA|nr:hypothetical protein H072_6549 [Dactylellina haptotyla CBS 200.50]
MRLRKAIILLSTTLSYVKAVSRTSAPAGCLVVGGSGGYTGFNAAFLGLGSGSASSSACIFVNPGTYAEQITVSYKGNLTLYGYTTDTGSYKNNQVVLTHTLGSYDAGSLDASATANFKSNNVKVYNINFVNGYTGGQAVAVVATGTRQGFYGCGFKSYQDTLYAKSGTQYYSNCNVIGAVDYIFGAASAWFGECSIQFAGGGYITASSRGEVDSPVWYAFDHCTISAVSGVTMTNNGYLGRPWRQYARVIFQYCSLPSFINPAGWTTLYAGATPLFYEYQNTGAGSGTSQRLYESSISAAVSKTTVLGSDWGSWIDRTY